MNSLQWTEYLDNFHRDRPGITEDILTNARGTDGQDSPYRWLLEPLDGAAPVLDVACGSAPLRSRSSPHGWIGVDRSEGELRRAAASGAQPLVRGNATMLPFATGRFRAVVCSMAIMVLQPFEAAVTELARVLAPGGVGVLLLPGRRPLTISDLARYARLMMLLRQTHLTYPNDRDTARLPAVLTGAGLEVTSDERRRFAIRFDSRDSVDMFVNSLYLPRVPAARVAATVATLQRWNDSELGVPLRRIGFRRA